MTCIEPDMIQKYIDKEANPEEVALIENHVIQCKTCAAKIEMQLKLATYVKSSVNMLTDETIDIPEFVNPSFNRIKHFITPRKLGYSVAAACILVFFLIIFKTKKTADEKNVYFMQLVEYDYDANRTLLEQQMVIEIIDPEGNVSEYFLE